MQKFIIFTIFYIILILSMASIAYYLEKKNIHKKPKKKKTSITNFINNYQDITFKMVAIGIIFGIMFGLMDNISLYFGVEGLGNYLKDKYNLSETEIAGISNTYSGVLGITFATFMLLITKNYFPDVDQDNLPVWLNMLGYAIGAILGIFVPKMFINLYNHSK